MADPGEGPRGLGPPLFLDENEARRADNIFFEAGPPLSQGLDDRPPPPLSEGLDPPLVSVCCEHHRASAPRTLPFCITGHGILTTNALAW